jgi:hypothetical protein
MKLKYLGLFLIIIGFATPYTLSVIFPTFLYASVPSVLCFWAGFLLILRPLNNDHKFNPYFKWASYAIWLNIMLTVLLLLYFYLIIYLDIRRGVGLYTMLFLSFVVNPIQSIFDRLVAVSIMQQTNGSALVTQSFIRSLLTNFFNLVFYCIVGIFAKVLKDKKITSGSIGRAKTARL